MWIIQCSPWLLNVNNVASCRYTVQIRAYLTVLQYKVSQEQISEYSWPLFEFVLSLRRTFQKLRCVTSHIRDHISKGTAPLAHSQTTDLFLGAADYLPTLNKFRTGLLDKGKCAHRSNSFLRNKSGNWTDTPLFLFGFHVTIRWCILCQPSFSQAS